VHHLALVRVQPLEDILPFKILYGKQGGVQRYPHFVEDFTLAVTRDFKTRCALYETNRFFESDARRSITCALCVALYISYRALNKVVSPTDLY